MADRTPLPPEALLEQLGWLRSLAQRLVRDEHLADDLSQDAALAALSRPGIPDSIAVRAWFGGVLRNLRGKNARSEGRRRERERRASRPEAHSGAGERIERFALQRAVVDAVLDLAEPYRSVIIMRYFEELPPRKIASELGVPVSTVKTRLARGIERLRRRLDRLHDGRREQWVGALVPLLSRPDLPLLTIGVLAMKTKVSAAIVVVALLLGAFWWWQSGVFDPSARRRVGVGDGLASGETAAAKEIAADAIDSREQRGTDAQSELVESKRAVNPKAETLPSEEADVAWIRGRVIDVDSRPVPRVEIEFRPQESDDREGSPAGGALSDVDGIFELPEPETNGTLVAVGTDHATVLSGVYEKNYTQVEPLVVVAAAVRLAGRVLDERGRALPGVTVSAAPPQHFRARFEAILDGTRRERYIAETDARGQFELPSVPRFEGAMIEAKLDGYEKLEVAVPPYSDASLELVLHRPKPLENVVRGEVIDAQGVPVPQSYVALGRDGREKQTAVTDAAGRFELELDDGKIPERILAVRRGQLPAILERPSENEGWPDRLVLQLGGPPLELSGRVIDAEGEPREKLKVWVADPTYFGLLEIHAHVENILGDEENRGWLWVPTDDEGRFLIEGLLPRRYTLHVLDPESLMLVKAGPFDAGATDLNIEFEGEDMFENVAGRVVDGEGVPVPSVRVVPVRRAFQVSFGGWSSSFNEGGKGAVTGDDGSFVLPALPQENVLLSLSGDSIIPIAFGYEDADGLAPLLEEAEQGLELVVQRRCYLRIDLGEEQDRVSHFEVLDAQGNSLQLTQFSGENSAQTNSPRIVSGRTPVYAVSESARTLVLYKGSDDVKRLAIRLAPGEVQLIFPF